MKRIKTSFLIAISIFGYGMGITAATLISPKQLVFMQKKYLKEDKFTRENSTLKHAYIPHSLKTAVRNCTHKYPELSSIIDLSLFLDNTQHTASHEALKELTQDFIQLLQQSQLKNIDPRDTTIQVMQKYLSDLESGSILVDLEKESALDDIQRSINLFNTNTGIALSAGGELNIYGSTNVGTQGSGNTVTIGLNSTLTVTGALFLSSLTNGVVTSSSTGVLSSEATTTNAVQIGNTSGTLTSIGLGKNGQVLLGATGAAPAFAALGSPDDSIIYSSGAHSLSLQANPLFGHVIRVDAVNGNDATGAVNGLPFATINAAVTAAGVAGSGTTIWILPGTYTLTSAITIPTGVNIMGLSKGTGGVMINYTATTSTTLITMGSNSRLENVDIMLSSSTAGITTTGISFPGTTNATATVDHISLIVTNTTSASGSTVVEGIVSTGTGSPSSERCALRNSTINVSLPSATGAASAIGVEINSANNFNIMTCNIVASAGALSTAMATGVQTDSTGICTINNSTISGSNTATPSNGNDILPMTANTIALSNTTLVNATSSSTSFVTTASPSIVNYIGTGPLGSLFVTPVYMYAGTTSASTESITESFTQIPMQQPCVAKGLRLRAGSSAGLGNTCTFTVNKNGTPGSPSLTAALTGTALVGQDLIHAVSFTGGDLLSVKASSSSVNATNDVVVTLELY